MKAARKSLQESVRELEGLEKRVGPSPIRLWEGHREQAFLWRALAVLQIPSTILAATMAIIMFYFSDQIVDVPHQPEPGYFPVSQITDQDFVKAGVRVVNFISSYQPSTAEAQFEATKQLLWEPALSQFDKEYIKRELPIIIDTARAQLFYMSNRQIKVERHDDEEFVVVRIPGRRQKLIGPQIIPADEIVWYVKLTTIPRNELNELGIVAINIKVEKMELKRIALEDFKELQQKRKDDREAEREKIKNGG